jgi:CRP-like cAMP-binding protein
MWIDDYSIAPRVRADFASLVWYLSYRHDVPLPNPAQDLYLFDGAATAIEAQVSPGDVRQALLRSPLMSEVADDVLDQVAKASTIETYQQGEVILVTVADELDVLVDGSARLVLRSSSGAEMFVLDHQPGEVLGLLGGFADPEYEAFVVADSDCRIVRVPAHAASASLAGSNELATALEQLGTSRRRRCQRVVRRAQRVTEQILDASDVDAPGRGAGA